jgi:hypothetical protein
MAAMVQLQILAYTRHARDRMRERGISEGEVAAVVTSPSVSYTDQAGNPIHIGYPGGRRIKVVLARGIVPVRIITAAD